MNTKTPAQRIAATKKRIAILKRLKAPGAIIEAEEAMVVRLEQARQRQNN